MRLRFDPIIPFCMYLILINEIDHFFTNLTKLQFSTEQQQNFVARAVENKSLYLTKHLSKSSLHQHHSPSLRKRGSFWEMRDAPGSTKTSRSCWAVYSSASLCLSNVPQTVCVSLSLLYFNCLFITCTLYSFQLLHSLFSFTPCFSSLFHPFALIF